jgi:hypothetical protein
MLAVRVEELRPAPIVLVGHGHGRNVVASCDGDQHVREAGSEVK